MYLTAMLCLLLAAETQAARGSPVSTYGHAYQAPGDFTDEEFKRIASNFPVFTVEKRHAFSIYGDKDAPAGSPHRFNSIKASVETARKIKVVNPDAKVLMYWNSAIHFNMYECEELVNSSWLMPPTFHPGQGQGLYDYSVPEFRQWWIDCAAEAVLNSGGMLDGLFLDALPKVNWQHGLPLWNAMVDQLSARIGEQHFLMYNGFFLPSGGSNPVSRIIAKNQLAHANLYCESFDRAVSTRDDITLGFLNELQAALKNNPSKILLGHGPRTQSAFSYVYGCFLMVAPRAGAYFLANDGYRVDQGLLDDHAEYDLGLGDPVGDFSVDGLVLTRSFEQGSVRVDLASRTAIFNVGTRIAV